MVDLFLYNSVMLSTELPQPSQEDRTKIARIICVYLLYTSICKLKKKMFFVQKRGLLDDVAVLT